MLSTPNAAYYFIHDGVIGNPYLYGGIPAGGIKTVIERSFPLRGDVWSVE